SIGAGGHDTEAVIFSMPVQVWFGSEIGFTATASVAADPACAAPAVEPYVVTTGKTYQQNICTALRQIQLSDLHVRGPGPAGEIAPGGDLEIDVVMTNPGPLGASWYPFVRATTDNPGVAQTVSGGLYALGPGASSKQTLRLHVDAAVPHAT